MKGIFVLAAAFALTIAAPQPRALKPRLDGRIIGGEDVDIADFPYQVSYLYSGSHICGGVIISADFVVTAAHCTDGAIANAINVRAGSTFHAFGGVTIPITQFYQHPRYDYRTIDFDISLLHLTSSLTFSANISPAVLPSPGADWEVGTSSVVSGWGYTGESGSLSPHLQAVQVPIVSRDACITAYGQGAVTERMLCAGVPQGGLDACQGDSGGPLVVPGAVLAGIVSWGYGCARPDFPGVYSHVGALRSYITEIAKI